MLHKIKSISAAVSNFDLQKVLMKLPIIASGGERRLFTQLLLLNLIAFGMFVTHHMLHNHTPRFPWIAESDQLFAGRWFNIPLIHINYLADMPIYGPLIGIVFSILSGMLVLKIWRLSLSASEQFVTLGLLTAFPISLVYFYYTYQTPLFCIALLFAAAAMLTVSRFTAWRIALGAAIAMLAFASYQPSVSVMATIAVSAFIADLARDEGAKTLEAVKTLVARTLSIGVGAILYRTSLTILDIKISKATSTVALEDQPARIVKVVQKSFEHLTTTQPDLLSFMKTLLTVLLVAAVVAAVAKTRRRLASAALIMLASPVLIIASKAMFLLSPDNGFFSYRYNMAMAFMHAFSFALLIHCLGLRLLRSCAFALGAFLLLRFVQADLVRQEVLYRGEQHDLALANRILSRMEELPDLDVAKTYDLVRIGKYSTFRQTALSSNGEKSDTYGDSHMDNGEVTDRWTDESVFVLLGTKIKFEFPGLDTTRSTDPNFLQKETDAHKTLLAGRKPWPDASSVFIHDDTIYVYMN